MRVLVTGGRAYGERWADPKAPPSRRAERPRWRDEVAHVRRVLDELAAGRGPLQVVQGGAAGADRRAKEWADHHHAAGRGPAPVTFDADWKGLGRAAGPARNAAMVAAGADLVVAFPGGRGTSHCVVLALAAGLPVRDERGREPDPREAWAALGEAVRAARVRLGLGVRQVAARLGASPAALGEFERGEPPRGEG